MFTSNYFNCANCLWYDNCENDSWEIDHAGHVLNAECDDYSPIDDNDEIALYKADLDMRRDAYYHLIEEFQ